MRWHCSVLVLTTCAWVLMFGYSSRADEAPPTTSPSGERSGSSETHRVKYRPPRRGAPQERVGGGTRGNDDKTPVIAVLAPEHAGFTTQAQVPLVWFISADTEREIEVVISRDDVTKPVYEASIKLTKSGFHTIDLALAGVTLDPGVEYHWSVAVIVDPSRRAGDVIAGGAIIRVEPDEALVKKLAAAARADRAAVYAENGIWYDAVHELSRQIEEDRRNAALFEARSDLLRQVQLKEAAEADAKAAAAVRDTN